MHFFIDHTQLNQVSGDMKFGPNPTNPTIEFDLSTQFQLSATTKAFSCQDGLMIVQESAANPSLVNVIIKSVEGLKIPFGKVKYFVYRGLSKNSFISGQNIVAQGSGNSEFIARLWTDWNNYKGNKTLPDPGPKSFGYDNSLFDTLDVEKIYDNSQTDVRSIYVKEGEWIGNFEATTISFEVIVETDNICTLEFLRADKYQIDITGLSGLEERAKREQILSFIDPAAFFGLHYDEGITVPTNNGKEKKKRDDLYTSIISKFSNKNNVYLDIRSEKGYSYNFYQNYGDIKIGNSQVTPTEECYAWDCWPLVKIDSSMVATSGNKNNIKIQLRIDDNTKPILFCENENVLSNNSSKFIDEKKLLNGNATDWSKDLTLTFPNSSGANVAYYIQLHYFRQEHNPASPNMVLKNEKDIDNIFGTLDMRFLGDTNYIFKHSINPNLFFLKGQFLSLEKFSYIAKSGAYYDNERVAFYVQMAFPYKSSKNSFPNTDAGTISGLNLAGTYNKMSFLAKNIEISKFNIQEIIAPSTYQKVDILDIFAYNGVSSAQENVFILGITQTELAALTGVVGFSNKHPRYIVFEDVTPAPSVDKDGKAFKKYKLKVQGVKNNGDSDIIFPASDVFVYTTKGFVFASKDFAEQEMYNHMGSGVVIYGTAKSKYLSELQKGAERYGVRLEMNNGKLRGIHTGTGTISTEGQQILNAVNAKNILIKINADYKRITTINGITLNLIVGAFGGNEINGNSAIAYQYVNPSDLEIVDDFFEEHGQTSLHEMTEAYEGAKISIVNGISSGLKGTEGSVYDEAHINAISSSAATGSIFRADFDEDGINILTSGKEAKTRRWWVQNDLGEFQYIYIINL